MTAPDDRAYLQISDWQLVIMLTELRRMERDEGVSSEHTQDAIIDLLKPHDTGDDDGQRND